MRPSLRWLKFLLIGTIVGLVVFVPWVGSLGICGPTLRIQLRSGQANRILGVRAQVFISSVSIEMLKAGYTGDTEKLADEQNPYLGKPLEISIPTVCNTYRSLFFSHSTRHSSYTQLVVTVRYEGGQQITQVVSIPVIEDGHTIVVDVP